MIEQHKDRYGGPPGEMLVDGGFASRDDIDSASTAEPPIVVYAPVQKSRKNKDTNCYERQPADTDAVAQWRQRMATPEAQEIYKQRAADGRTRWRNRGMQQFLVRGLEKVKAVVLWFGLAQPGSVGQLAQADGRGGRIRQKKETIIGPKTGIWRRSGCLLSPGDETNREPAAFGSLKDRKHACPDLE